MIWKISSFEPFQYMLTGIGQIVKYFWIFEKILSYPNLFENIELIKKSNKINSLQMLWQLALKLLVKSYLELLKSTGEKWKRILFLNF